MMRKLTNKKNEKLTLQDLEYGKKTDKQGKRATYMVGREIWQETVINVQNEKHTLQDMEYGKTQ